MYKVIKIQNFRGFQDITISGLTPINIFTGLNGTGKTTILESAFLVSGGANATLAASLYGFRGDFQWAVGDDLPFRSIFRNLDSALIPTISASSSITMEMSQKYFRELKIVPSFSALPGQSSTQQKTQLTGVEFSFRGPSGAKKHVFGWRHHFNKAIRPMPKETTGEEASVTLGGEPAPNPDLINATFVSPYFRGLQEQDNQTLVQLVKERRIPEVVRMLNLIDPRIKDIQPLTEHGIPVVYVDIGEAKLLPISLLGAGVANVLHIVLPLIQYKNAKILIDEFEDGLHHSIFRPLLAAVFSQAKESKNQLFISTHSDEFLRALLGVCKEQALNEEISFFRLAKRKAVGSINKFSLSEVESLLDSNLDVR